MNEKTKYYYSDLPEDYEKDYVIDAKDKKFTIVYGIILNFVLIALTITLCLVIKGASINEYKDFIANNYLFSMVSLIVFALALLAYIILHELTHGLFYKLLTHEKLTFGLTLTVAYCGIPTIYCKKIPAIITLLAPFITFTLAFGIPLFFTNNLLIYLLLSIILGIHVGGCIGDLYGTIIILFKYHGKDILINDTGPKQTFYIKK